MAQQHSDKISRAYITLLTVIILSSIAAVMITTVLIISTENFQANQRLRQTLEAKALAETCAEFAISKLKDNLAYAGSESLSLSYGTCNVQAITGSGNSNRTITTDSTVGSSIRREQVVITTVDPLTTISSWQEIQ